ncbi:hypothetical protein PV08_02063 [Exophiala spinifera]|uniref:Uncharacterized protein n=1 Tax=Exophiala spinifera TaxID=91928 RepID=A0A0D2BR51_9EURO|nr:uncharacterized protein PV08_02063 [Exophiala spinifera]KIW21483.1 hypothetical protein PV08_02063 [Exophiala spinifera]
MRLLNTATRKLEQFFGDKIPQYAILSHTWGEDEVSLQDLERVDTELKAGYQKIKNTCSLAAAHGFDYVWIDTCCIDKTSSAELSEAINSMYRWYEGSGLCYAYLEDVSSRPFNRAFELWQSRWFTRGWTLQELIAPAIVLFLSKEWEEIGTKSSLRKYIQKITRVPINILEGDDLESASVAQRMSWAAERQTTRVEDIAYCLMGIFDVNMPLLYGEGDRAFRRLQEEIMKVSDDQSLFAWDTKWRRPCFLAPSPRFFYEVGDIVPLRTSSGAISMNNEGIHLKVSMGFEGYAILQCAKKDRRVAVPVQSILGKEGHFKRGCARSLKFLDSSELKNVQLSTKTICMQAERLRPQRVRPLVATAENGNKIVVETLLEKGVHTRSKDHEHRRALLRAAENGHDAIVELLLEDCAGLYTQNDLNEILMHLVTKDGHHAAVKLLLKNGADPGTRVSITQLLLTRAAINGNEAVVKLLLKNGAYPHIRDY